MQNGTRQTRRKRISDERLLDGACAEFAQYGFKGASMDAVARAAHTTKATLYARFGSKEQLFEAAAQREADLLRTELLRAYRLDPEIDLDERLHTYVNAYFTYASGRPNGLKVLFIADADASNTIGLRLRAEITDRIAELVAGSFGEPEPSESHRLIAALIAGATHNGAGACAADGVSASKAARITEQFLSGALGLTTIEKPPRPAARRSARRRKDPAVVALTPRTPVSPGRANGTSRAGHQSSCSSTPGF